MPAVLLLSYLLSCLSCYLALFHDAAPLLGCPTLYNINQALFPSSGLRTLDVTAIGTTTVHGGSDVHPSFFRLLLLLAPMMRSWTAVCDISSFLRGTVVMYVVNVCMLRHVCGIFP